MIKGIIDILNNIFLYFKERKKKKEEQERKDYLEFFKKLISRRKNRVDRTR